MQNRLIPKVLVVATGWHHINCARNFDPGTVVTVDIDKNVNANYTLDLSNGTDSLPHNHFDLVYVEALPPPKNLQNVLDNISKLLTADGLLIYVGWRPDDLKKKFKLAKFSGIQFIENDNMHHFVVSKKKKYKKANFLRLPYEVQYFFSVIRKLPIISKSVRKSLKAKLHAELSHAITNYEAELGALTDDLRNPDHHFKFLRLRELYRHRADCHAKKEEIDKAIADYNHAFKFHQERIQPFYQSWPVLMLIHRDLFDCFMAVGNKDAALEQVHAMEALLEEHSYMDEELTSLLENATQDLIMPYGYDVLSACYAELGMAEKASSYSKESDLHFIYVSLVCDIKDKTHSTIEELHQNLSGLLQEKNISFEVWSVFLQDQCNFISNRHAKSDQNCFTTQKKFVENFMELAKVANVTFLDAKFLQSVTEKLKIFKQQVGYNHELASSSRLFVPPTPTKREAEQANENSKLKKQKKASRD